MYFFSNVEFHPLIPMLCLMIYVINNYYNFHPLNTHTDALCLSRNSLYQLLNWILNFTHSYRCSLHIYPGALLLVLSGSAKQQCLTPSSSVDYLFLVSIFYVCLHLCAWSFSLLDHSSSTNLAVKMECRIFVSNSCNVKSSLSLMSVDDPNSKLTRTNNRRFLS